MSNLLFTIKTQYKPQGDQPEAIKQIVSNIQSGVKDQVLLGVTGSGKTFTMANVIAQCNRPALILAPNKTLAAQLYNEFKELFPYNAVEYFVSYYDYYQPEAYVPSSDVYIEKDSSINDDIDKLRHAATHALLTRRDVIIIASVSCIYGLGSPEYYARLIIPVEKGQQINMDEIITRLVDIQYQRNDMDFHRATFRVRGDVLEIIPAYEHERALRLEFFGNEIEEIREIDPLTGEVLGNVGKTVIYPASHYVSDRDNLIRAMTDIQKELCERLYDFQATNKLVEAQRLEQKTQLDLEMIQEFGYCNGIENYSRHLDGRKPGDPPSTLLDYFPKDFLFFIDESHIAIPQVGGMFKGDRSRKQTLVDFGFRLPSALDNRPLEFHEFLTRLNQVIYVSATPGPWELDRSQGIITEQIIRPTGLLDPEIEVRPIKGQIESLLEECYQRVNSHERVLITTLTKRMAEDLTDYLNNMSINTRYLHSDIDTLERMAIIKSLRTGEFDVLVGINLLREGLDIPEVSLVAILDADKEGFLRSTGSLIQTFGRAARNVSGKVILFADTMTKSMKAAIDETRRRRALQQEWNTKHNITPKTIQKSVVTPFDMISANTSSKKGCRKNKHSMDTKELFVITDKTSPEDITKYIKQLEYEMKEAAKELEFEKAAVLRDRIKVTREQFLLMS
ncbi:excinuclease ABC subunit UvrB [Lawsonia intracellularis]|uniref:UvrABC system protein B n=1 Tax=Lawsonia intracellularis (strain PHE/MN1-00) TaxID=363253 RepID=Q1MRS9_LAWIP|nr:excinuclease ABC subunit UvrB [Lawsonia intracellularis]AGC49650.1 excinuclease ABC subunit B [Lawsonia intracellularis N343]KAA0205156.1 excinuclease ABC subunit UvrB [Lawsonia intracellularis]MBZ3892316.1 excinuclease ABC subunit UvrB [Lawsonia intracellularis]OMQ05983.1 excinuclease ABC subunit B [Lawsonia intracellularis]RBN32297.1 excinuclease ABC subunit UvrB [Lawsonia intracellularis]